MGRSICAGLKERDGVLRLRPSSVPPCHPSNARRWVWQRPAAHNEARHPFAAVSDKAVLGKGASSVRGQWLASGVWVIVWSCHHWAWVIHQWVEWHRADLLGGGISTGRLSSESLGLLRNPSVLYASAGQRVTFISSILAECPFSPELGTPRQTKKIIPWAREARRYP